MRIATTHHRKRSVGTLEQLKGPLRSLRRVVWQGSSGQLEIPTDSCSVPCTSDTVDRAQWSLAQRLVQLPGVNTRRFRHSPAACILGYDTLTQRTNRGYS